MPLIKTVIHAPHLAPKVRSESAGPVETVTREFVLPPEPTIAELALNFGEAMERWTRAGFPTVSRAEYEARSAACEPCELWDGQARFGLGKCQAPGCGCTQFKRWLGTERCKHPAGSKWPQPKTQNPKR